MKKTAQKHIFEIGEYVKIHSRNVKADYIQIYIDKTGVVVDKTITHRGIYAVKVMIDELYFWFYNDELILNDHRSEMLEIEKML